MFARENAVLRMTAVMLMIFYQIWIDKLFECFWVGKVDLSLLLLFQIKGSLLKNAKKLKKLLKIETFF